MKKRARPVPGITVRIACAQLHARSVRDAAAALDDIVGAVRLASRRKAGLVILPECSYPGYVLLDSKPYRRRIPSARHALRAIAAAASRFSIAVALGIVRPLPDGTLRNEAVLFDARGRELCSYAKSHLWNLDHHWFSPGARLPVCDTEFGRIGMMICADGRVPEIARTLTRSGAWLILDPTAWVSSGPTYESMRNIQADSMLRVRALENGVWIAAADKCGSELGSVHYVGRSQIVRPDGSIAALAGSSAPEMIVAEARRSLTRPFVAALSERERHQLRALPRRDKPARAATRRWLGVFQSASHADDPLAVRALEAQGAQVVIRTRASRAEVSAALAALRGVRFACIEGHDMLAPEPARAAALGGADAVVWLRPPQRLPVLDIARSRAVENRIYIVVCARARRDVSACVINPDGQIVGCALTGIASGFVACIDSSASRHKGRVPFTDIFADRTPKIYRLFDAAKPKGAKAHA